MNKETVTVKRIYKDTVFRILYRDKKNLLELYNALHDSDYTDEDALDIVTLENAIYMSMKNDLAYVMDYRMYLYEHQATYNPNMPLRDLFYVSSEYQKMVTKSSLYSSVPVTIPAPHFVVFYNGIEERPEKEILKLSDLYTVPEEVPMLELQVQVLNINDGFNCELKEKCETLQAYMLYVGKVREYTTLGMELSKAVENAVDECIRKGILADFLRANRAEVISMSIFEYDEEQEIRLLREAERSAGEESGKAIGKEIGLSAMVNTLKRVGKSLEETYREVISNVEYGDITMEKIEEYYNK